MSSRRSAEWQRAFWFAFFVFFVGAGALPLDGMSKLRRVSRNSPFSSNDAIYRDELGLSDGAAALQRAFEGVPLDTPITVVYLGGSMASLAGVLVMQLLYQRPVEELAYSGTFGSAEELEKLRKRGGLVFFISTEPPPSLGTVVSSRPMFHIIRVEAVQ